MWLGIIVAVLYGAIAVFANFINKYAIRVLPLPNVILLIQTVTAALILRLIAACRLIRVPPLGDVPLLRLAPLAAWYTAHAALVLCSLASLSVPMYNTLKRLTPVLVLVAKIVMDRAWPDAHTSLSVILIVSGCFVAGAGDLSFDLQGYLLALMATVAQAGYILSAEKEVQGKSSKGGATGGGGCSASGVTASACIGKDVEGGGSGGVDVAASTQRKNVHLPDVVIATHVQDLQDATASAAAQGGGNSNNSHHISSNSTSSIHSGKPPPHPHPHPPPHQSSAASSQQPLSAPELLYCLSVIGIPPLALLCVTTGEGSRAPAALAALHAAMGGRDFVTWFATMAVTNGLLNGGVILCTQLNSALTTAIVGVLKGAISSVLGFFLLGGVKFHALNVAGITMNMVGGIWYSANKYVRQRRAGGGGGGSAALTG